MKIHIISLLLLLVSISVVSGAGSSSNPNNHDNPNNPNNPDNPNNPNNPDEIVLGLDPDLEQKFIEEMENNENDDGRPNKLKVLEKRLEYGMDKFVKKGLKDFKRISYSLRKAINPDNTSHANEKKPFLFQTLNHLSSMFSSSDENLVTQFKKFKVHITSIRELNNQLMDQLKEVYNIITVSVHKPMEPKKEIKKLSIGSSSTSDKNNMKVKETIDMIPVISQAMKCRFKVVYAVNWIRLRLGYFKKKVEWMKFREELVKLNQKYHVIEMNLLEYLTSFNKMMSNPDKRDDSKIKEMVNYFKETIEKGEFNSITEEIIEMIERTGNRELLLQYFNVCKQEMRGEKIIMESLYEDKGYSDYIGFRLAIIFENIINNLFECFLDDVNEDLRDSYLNIEMRKIRSTFCSSNDYNKMVAQTMQAIETLKGDERLTDSDSESLENLIRAINVIYGNH